MLKKLLIVFVSFLALFFLFNYVIMPLYVKHSDTAKVPKVTGMNFIEAKQIIEDAGLEIKQGEVKYDENIQIGMILDQNPPSEETVKHGRRVYVTISGGEQLSEVPNLKGKSLRDAKFTLEQRGLKVGETVRKNTPEFPEDYVVSQIIQPGSKLKKNSTIDLILSDGPLAGDLRIPSLTGKTLVEAKKIITDSKLKLGKITYQTNNDIPEGQIVDQYPKFDKSANENTTVDLFVSRKKAIEIIEPEVTDTDESDIENNVPKETDTEKTKDNTKDNTKEKATEKPKDNTKEPPADKNTDKKPPAPDKGTDDPTKKDDGN